MHWLDGYHAILNARSGHAHGVGFVSPILSALVAVEVSRNPKAAERFTISPAARSYAEHIGLLAVLEDHPPTTGAPMEGSTYVRLRRVDDGFDVDSCTTLMGELFERQISQVTPSEFVRDLTGSVGELLDNVSSHALGSGFVAAQVYSDGASKRVEVAVVDAGCGLRGSCNRAGIPLVDSDADAIEWCIAEGHTTARVPDMAQRLPEGHVGSSPFPRGVVTRDSDDNHQGLGLPKLCNFVKRLERSTASIWTGDARLTVQAGGDEYSPTRQRWDGVAVELSLVVPASYESGNPWKGVLTWT